MGSENEVNYWFGTHLLADIGKGSITEADFARLARRLAELERERDAWKDDAIGSERRAEVVALRDEATTLRADLAHARAEAERLRGVVGAAMRLRDSGYDGPFIGEPVEELFTALATLDGAGEGEGAPASDKPDAGCSYEPFSPQSPPCTCNPPSLHIRPTPCRDGGPHDWSSAPPGSTRVCRYCGAMGREP